MPREKLTDEQIQKIVADFVEMKNYSAVARKNNVSDNTVRKYVAESSDISKKFEQKKAQNTLDMLDYMDSKKERVQEIIDVYLGVLTDPGKLDSATLREITTALGTLIDKWTKMDAIKKDVSPAAQTANMQTLADLLQHPAPDRDIKDFET